MSNLWHSLNLKEELLGVIEMPQGSTMKLELEKTTGAIKLDRFIKISVPAHYGFIPQTLSEDGDPLDVFIFSSHYINPLTVVKLVPERFIHAIDNGVGDSKIIATVAGDTLSWSGAQKRTELVVDYLKRYKEGMTVVDVLDHNAAKQAIVIAYNNYMQKYNLRSSIQGDT